jgi:MFS transporter, NNP family, nitrate/nitrite transporter
MKIIWFVNLAILVAFVKVFEIPSMIPIFVVELDISYAQAGIFMTAYSIVRCLSSFPAGSITDKWGAVPVILLCLLSIGVFGILGTFGSNYYVMLILRVLVSIGVAIIFIAAVDAIPKYMPSEKVGHGIGYINASLNIGIALALFITPIIADSIGWRWTARIYSFSLLLLFLAALPLLKNLNENRATQVSSSDASISLYTLLSNPAVLILSIGTGVLFIELYGVLTWVPVFLAEVYKYSPSEIGASATMFGLAAIPASIVTGYLCTNLRRIVWLCVSGGSLAGLGILFLISSSHLPLWLTMLTITIITWGHSQVVVTIMSIASLIVPPHSSGKALGLVFTFAYGGSIVPTYLGGYLLTKTGEYQTSFILFAGSAFLSIIAMLIVSNKLKNNPPSHFSLKYGA